MTGKELEGRDVEGQNLWLRVSEIFADLMELPKDRRPQALASMCADDVGLRRRVERYLELEARSRHFLAKPAFSLRGTSRPDSSERLVGGRVGPWRLTGCLGRGGMGIVFSASRDDGHFEQEAALKLLSDAKVSAENLARFHAERQILAGLEHPGIARLVDGGTTDEGLPYLVMERVIGQSIDEAIQGLARRERLELFLAICEAVEVAHQNLIVHRDLKPSNILVTAVGQPKLLDFGIAKWLRDEGELTQPGAGPMTPKWASPEQLQGGRITTATDVYALGLLLYFMLVGDLPEPDRSIDSSSGRRARDRKAIGPQAGGLGEELAILVAKALERDPADRYTSARQLADDVKRYLTNRPILARPPKTLYLARKFIRRHAWGSGLVISLLMSLVAFSVSTTLKNKEILAQRRAIEAKNRELTRERDRSREVIDFMVGTFRRQDPQSHPGQAPSLRQVLEAAEARLAFDLEHQPGVRAGMMDVIGRVHMNLADFEKARPNLEAALMLREVHGSDVERAESLHNLAALDRHQGRLQDAEARMRRALALQQGAPDDVDSDLARGLANLGSLLIEKGQPAEAVPFIEGALAIQERIFGESHAETARSFNTLATALSRLRRPDEAEIYYRRSVEIRRALGSARRPQLAASLSNLAVLLTHRGAFGEAEQLQREALAIRRDIYDDGHPRLASGLNGLALTLIRAHRSTEALSLVREAIEILESSGAPAWRAAIVRKNHALALAASGDCRAASVEAAEVQETLERAGRQVAAGDARAVEGWCLAVLGDRHRGMELFSQALVDLEREVGRTDWRWRHLDEILRSQTSDPTPPESSAG